MRIFQLCGDRGIAPDGSKGASVHLRSLARAFADLGHELVQFSARSPAAGSDGSSPRRASGHRAADLLREAAAGGRPDVIYERYSLGAAEGLRASRELGVPLVLEVNAPLVEEARRHRPDTVAADDARIEDELLRTADLVVAVSEPLRRWVVERRGRVQGAIRVANGVDAALFRAVPDEVTPGLLAFLGHPKPWHGADRLPGLLARLPAATRLVVIGGGPGAEALLPLARREGVEDRIEITGPIAHEDAIDRLARATISLAPYRPCEFFYFSPLKIVESMAAGTPIVASDLGEIRQLMGEAGIAVPAGDDDAHVAAIRDLLEDRERREACGRIGRARALSEHTWTAVAREILSALDPVVARRGGRS